MAAWPGAPETDNQAALLRALRLPAARLVNNFGDETPIAVKIPGVSKPVLIVQRQTVRACLKRGWLTGNNRDGYAVNGLGITALGNRP